MATTDAKNDRRLVAIAPAPEACSTDLGTDGGSHLATKPYTCQNCTKRKVKCDKATPLCSSCRKGKLECFYQAPPPRWRKRKLSDDVDEKLARYERILHKHGLLPQDAEISPSIKGNPQEPISSIWNEPGTSTTGKLLTSHGKSRYVDSNFWRTLGDDEIPRMSEDEEEDEVIAGVVDGFASDPFTGAFMGSQKSLLQYHPCHTEAIRLWKTHSENVEPLCKILHIPSTSKMVEMASQQPAVASKAEECLLFAIYHFAVFSMSAEDCMQILGQPRATLLPKYHFATRQALVNATFLKTTEISIVQALVLFLLPCRYFYDPHTYWILTGVAVRIAQRLGLHRDGEKLGLPPFDVEMRRRLFYQLLPLDSIASHMSGTGSATVPDTWDTQRPLNINDDQIWLGMTEKPEEQKAATEMIFCLARSCIGKSFARAGRSMLGASSEQLNDYTEVERVISETEGEVEEKYIRFCDIVNPLHFLTIASARTGIIAMRIRILLPKVRDQTVTDGERRKLFQLSQKILDADTASYAHTALKKYGWHMRPFFLWGSWDSFILVLTTLCRSDFLSREETDIAWSKVEHLYNNHGELLESKQALYMAFGRLTLKAWDANPPNRSTPEPVFITTLRCLRKVNVNSRAKRHDSNTIAPFVSSLTNEPDTSSGSFFDDMSFDTGDDFNLNSVDWKFWDQLIQDYQVQGDEQEDAFLQ